MSLKRRNYIALVLLLVAAICWGFGQQMLAENAGESMVATTAPGVVSNTTAYNEPTFSVATEPAQFDDLYTAPTMAGRYQTADTRANRTLGFVLCIAACLAALTAILFLAQQAPILGPDGVFLLWAFLLMVQHMTRIAFAHMVSDEFRSLEAVSSVVKSFVVLFGVRELLGWLKAKLSLRWSLAERMVKRWSAPHFSLLILLGWIVLPLLGCVYYFGAEERGGLPLLTLLGYGAAAVFGAVCLWRYGKDLSHFQKQLDNYRRGDSIEVGEGMFSATEAQLLEARVQHEEAVRKAVTSERFKVELIANVSHDLRTPLTAILGYSELLGQESLSTEGQEQLRRLHQKAGYMNDLMESLFELTKVSSGVTESKRDRIDLIRLLEQTVGFFDDQLLKAELSVRRHYCADALPVITDGARMHQVFANLLGNAIKYALPGTRIYIEVKDGEDSCSVRMVNTASYEMDFDAEEILQRFARGDKARSTKGSGLGLAIAQTYTQSVGGTFHVAIDGDQFSAVVELPKTERDL